MTDALPLILTCAGEVLLRMYPLRWSQDPHLPVHRPGQPWRLREEVGPSETAKHRSSPGLGRVRGEETDQQR